MKAKCTELKTNGDPCTNWAMDTGYCNVHDPATIKKKEIDKLKEEDISYLQLKERQIKRRQEQLEILSDRIKNNRDEEVSDIVAAIKTIDDVESLRLAELEVVAGLVQEKIDPKAGGPIAAILKHQAELLGVSKRQTEGKKDPHRRNVMIAMSGEMTNDEVFELISNFAGGMKRLEQKAEQASNGEIITVEASQPELIEMEPSSEDVF